MTDELSAPLGVPAEPDEHAAPATASRAGPRVDPMSVAAGSVGCLLAALGAWILLSNNPLGGEPRAVAAIVPAPSRATEPLAPAPSTIEPAEARRDEGPVVNIINGMSGERREVRLTAPPPAERASGLDPRMSDRSRHGPLPRVAEDGRRPMDVYARTVRPTQAQATMPRVAVIVGGLGISAAGTAEAIGKLPGAVSLAFAPYGADLDRIVSRARADGHEIFLHVPMEPFDYPDNDPGPRTLLTTIPSDQNIDRLHWAMSRFQGYAGVLNFLGAKFTAADNALTPVMREIGSRGLLMVDDGSSARSLVAPIGGATRTPVLRADLTIDLVPTPAAIDAELARLEARAREAGFALAVASGLPVSIDRIAAWARALESRGILLVPATAGAPRRARQG